MNNSLPSISVSTSGVSTAPRKSFCPSGGDFHGKHSAPLGMTNPYLVVAGDKWLSGSYGGSAVHFQVRVVILPHKHLQDVQHLQGKRTVSREDKKKEVGAVGV